VLVPWTALRSSRTAKRWRGVGIAIGAISSLALVSTAAARPTVIGGLLGAAAIAVAACLWAASRRALPVFEIGVSHASELVLRRWSPPGGEQAHVTREDTSVSAQVMFAAPWLISLRSGTTLIPIWPDSLPPALYRRLWVYLHWGRAAFEDDRNPKPTFSENPMDR